MSTKHEEDKVIVYDRAGLIFVFNFHPTKSYTDYRVGAPAGGKYRIVLDTDDKQFGGHGRLDHSTEFFTVNDGFAGRPDSIMVFCLIYCKYKNFPYIVLLLQVYAPCRTGFILAPDNSVYCSSLKNLTLKKC